MNDTAKTYDYFLKERKKFHYPPYTKMIMLQLSHRKEDKITRASQFMGSVLRKYLPEECVLGPEKSPVFKINNMFQFQILIKLPRGNKYASFKKLVLKSIEEFDEITAYQSVKKHVLIDF